MGWRVAVSTISGRVVCATCTKGVVEANDHLEASGCCSLEVDFVSFYLKLCFDCR